MVKAFWSKVVDHPICRVDINMLEKMKGDKERVKVETKYDWIEK